MVRTGLTLSDEMVVTVGSYRRTRQLETLPDDTEIQAVNCGKVNNTYKIKSVRPFGAQGASPYLSLNVSGLKRKGPPPFRAGDL